jgi:acyl-CoA thioesterase FadM
MPGEGRIGHPGLVRLVECVRELHWARDVLSAAANVDSVTRSSRFEYLGPVVPGTQVTGRYRVTGCGSRSYRLEVVLSAGAADLVRAELVNVFYDAALGRSTSPPGPVLAALRRRAAGSPATIDSGNPDGTEAERRVPVALHDPAPVGRPTQS